MSAIDVAAWGWEPNHWSGDFYPDDLPEAWRLAYYANEFDAVVVPAALWGTLSAAVVEGWAAEVAGGFRFYWELPAAAIDGAARLCEVAAPLLGQSGGVLLSGRVAGEGAQRLAALASRLPALPLGLLPGEGVSRLGSLAVSTCPAQPRAVRDLLESLAGSPQPGGVMVCDDIAGLRQAKLVAHLLGVSRSP